MTSLKKSAIVLAFLMVVGFAITVFAAEYRGKQVFQSADTRFDRGFVKYQGNCDVEVKDTATVAYESGTSLDIESGATLKLAGTTVSASAAELNSLDADAGSVSTMWYGLPSPSVRRPGTYLEYVEEFTAAGYIPNAAANLGVTNSQVIQRGGLFSEVADQAEWLVTVTDGSGDNDESIVAADAAGGGYITITTTDDANDAVQIQKNGESFAVTTSKDLWYEAKIQVEDVSEDTVTWGLTVADTDISSFGNDFMLFQLDQSTNVSFFMGKNGALSTNLNITVLADAATVGTGAKKFGLYCDGSASNVYIYVDGVLVASNLASVSLPNDLALSPAVKIVTTDTGGDAISIDYIAGYNQK